MKTRIFLLSLASASVMLSCTDKLSEQLMWDEGVMATIPGYEDADGTRVSFVNGLGNFRWSNGDCIGVCRSSASINGTAAFTLLKGGEAVGNFINDSFSLHPETDYYAFYPFAAGTTATSFPVKMVTQEQKANNDLSHIGEFNYMSAKFTTNSEGKASFTFSNIGTVLQLHFTSEAEDTYRNLLITSSGTPFVISANYNLSEGTYSASSTNASFRVSFGEEGMHVYNGENVVISAVILPCDMSQSTLSFSIQNDKGVVKEMSFAGYAFSPGKVYHFYEVVHSGNPPYGGCPDGNHPHAIDLGLPSGTLWACMNLGAEKPLEDGIAFAWGQTNYVEKNTSDWSNYEFMDESLNNEWGITKYQIADNKTDGIWYNGETFVGDNKTTLEWGDDAARKNWGGAWRMPTKKEFEELINYTKQSGTDSYNGSGAHGRILYKKKSNNSYSLWDTHIFLFHDERRDFGGYAGTNYWVNWYWTSSLGSETRKAYYYYTANGYYNNSEMGEGTRTGKNQIRPVQSKSN
ncbi:MAG: fimbrillin family protein [Bacteroidales bacterium]|nr:fimbrillin family protein [Bacteroidales bacterium]